MEQGRRGSGAFGWLLFVLIIVAPRIAGPLSNWLTQTTGITVAPGAIVAGLIGLYVLSVLLVPAMRALDRARKRGDTSLATPTQPPQPLAPPRPAALPSPLSRRPPTAGSSLRLPDGPSPLPGPPRFEPIIDPRLLTFGIIGLLGLGVLLLVLFFIAGTLP